MNHRNVISAVVAMGLDLRINVAVKNVERESIAALVARLGVSHAQGYIMRARHRRRWCVRSSNACRKSGPLPIGR